MASLPSASSTRAPFDRLHPKVQRWVYQQGWSKLRDAQERAIEPILSGSKDVIISAATAAGKTEAAFLPICSKLLAERTAGGDESLGVQVLYVSPLKALINDQFDRLSRLCEDLDIPVHRWHGDVSMNAKQKVLKSPSGVLLITPESLEATFVRRGEMVRSIYQRVRYVVIDEMHSFLGVPRGVQVQSQLNRLELAIRRRPPRVGLSATLGDMELGARFLRPSNPESVVAIISRDAARPLQIALHGYIDREPEPPAGKPNDPASSGGVTNEIAQHLFDALRGSTNLVFANTREAVETFADALRRRSESLRVPEEFFAHHGNLSKEHREWVEEALKDPQRPATAICTSTLEMGIDIGSAETVAQIGCPPSVASLKQRVGRSGRRNNPGKLELYAQEYELTTQSDLAAELRVVFVQTMAMVELMLDAWVEPGDDPGFNYSTLIHQVLSTLAQHGGARAEQLHRALCGQGPFALADPDRFSQLLRAMGASKLLGQANDGTLVLGTEGERRTNHYSFYPVFQTTVEWRLVAAGKSLGTMPIAQPLIAGDFLIFGGRRWVILSADEKARLVELEPAGGGRVPRFEGSGVPQVADEVRRQMVRIYERSDHPEWLDSVAEVLLTEARGAWKAREMLLQPLRQVGSGVEIWPWAGDRRLSTAALALKSAGLKASKPFDSPSIIIENSTVDTVIAAARQLVASAMPGATTLARSVENPRSEKWDWVLSDDLAWEVEGARHLNVSAAWELLDLIASGQWTVSA